MINELIKDELKKIFDGKPLDKSISFYYRKIADDLNVHPERVRKHHRMLKEKENSGKIVDNDKKTWSFRKSTGDNLESTVIVDFEPKSPEELSKLHKIDLNKYTIKSYWTKMQSNGKFSSSVLAQLKSSDKDVFLQKQVLLDELKSYSPAIVSIPDQKQSAQKLLEIALPDVHFGKLSHSEESGEDYDLKLAGERFSGAINSILSSVNLNQIDRIFFPIGNDMFNVDNMTSTTTAGTPQDTDTRFHKMVRYVKNILIQEIDKLSGIAPVDVVVVPGNHDEQTAFMLGEILDAFYHKNDLVTVENSPKLRKYYQYGNTSILLTHGDKEKHSELGMIFAAEQPKLWADTKYRFIQLGHFHHNKKISYLANDEFQGFQIQILPSLSPNDKWHYGKGFLSLKQAKGFLYDFNKGLIAEYTYSI